MMLAVCIPADLKKREKQNEEKEKDKEQEKKVKCNLVENNIQWFTMKN